MELKPVLEVAAATERRYEGVSYSRGEEPHRKATRVKAAFLLC